MCVGTCLSWASHIGSLGWVTDKKQYPMSVGIGLQWTNHIGYLGWVTDKKQCPMFVQHRVCSPFGDWPVTTHGIVLSDVARTFDCSRPSWDVILLKRSHYVFPVTSILPYGFIGWLPLGRAAWWCSHGWMFTTALGRHLSEVVSLARAVLTMFAPLNSHGFLVTSFLQYGFIRSFSLILLELLDAHDFPVTPLSS